jgi:hypothetical protein
LGEKLTRRDIDAWLAEIRHKLDQIVGGPVTEIRGRVALLQRRIEHMRDRLKY